MQLGTQTTFVERLARLTGAVTIATASDATKTYINEGVREFAKRAHGVALDAFIDLNPNFHIGKDFAFKFTLGGNANTFGSADIQIATGTALHHATPTAVMNNIVTNVNSTMGSMTISMAWSASTWTFVLYGPASTTFCSIASPTNIGYTDAAYIVFGGPVSKASTVISCGFPQNLNLDTSLPSGFLEMQHVFYGSNELVEAPFSNFMRPFSVGTPNEYAIRNKEIYIRPVPQTQDYFRIFYNGMPDDLGVDGSSDSTACPLPESVHMAPVYWAAACLLEESHEFDKANYYQGKFGSMVNNFIIREANNNPTMFPGGSGFVPPNVMMSSI
jgi:hypothetical protein